MSDTGIRDGALAARPLLHGMVYGLHDGLLEVLISGVDGQDAVRRAFETERKRVGY